DGNNSSRLFDIDDGNSSNAVNISMTGLTLQRGNGNGANAPGEGGAIYNTEILTLNSDVITGNIIPGGNGAGGGIENDGGTLTSSNDVIQNNSAGGSNSSGGGIN